MSDSGTIDITDLVEKIRSASVTFEVNATFAAIALVPYMSWVTLPIISSFVKWVINWVFTGMSNREVQMAFYLNTAIRKAAQAKDFIRAHDAKENMPPTATKEEYQNAEKAQMLAFRNFVAVTN